MPGVMSTFGPQISRFFSFIDTECVFLTPKHAYSVCFLFAFGRIGQMENGGRKWSLDGNYPPLAST